MIQFLQPGWLWLLLLLPLIALWRGRRGTVAAVEFSSAETARQVARETRSRVGRWLPLLPLLALGFCSWWRWRVRSLAVPRTEVNASGIDMMLAIDVSGSMQSLDFKVNGEPVDRVGVVKSVVSKFIDERPNDRLGLVEFAGAPYLVSPLTLDHDWLQQNLERVKVGGIEDGTAIGSAIAMCANRLRNEPSKSKVDRVADRRREQHGKSAAAHGRRSRQGARHQGVHHRRRRAWRGPDAREGPIRQHADGDGEIRRGRGHARARSRRKPGGQFFRATDTDSLKHIYAQIDQLEKTTHTVKKFEHHSELFAWALFPGLLVLGSALGLEQTRFRRLP